MGRGRSTGKEGREKDMREAVWEGKGEDNDTLKKKSGSRWKISDKRTNRKEGRGRERGEKDGE